MEIHKMNKIQSIRIRVDDSEKSLLEKKAKEFGFTCLSEYLRFIGRNCESISVKIKNED